MTTERSDKLYDHWRQSAEKFDYFILGITGALCAYISQTYRPAKLGLNPGTLELLALLILICSAVVGFRRIEKSLVLTKVNHKWLKLNEERGALAATAGSALLINESTGEVISSAESRLRIQAATKVISALESKLESLGKQAAFAYSVRNWLILAGFLTLIIGKVWSAYTQG